jgi:hypothetical protein
MFFAEQVRVGERQMAQSACDDINGVLFRGLVWRRELGVSWLGWVVEVWSWVVSGGEVDGSVGGGGERFHLRGMGMAWSRGKRNG